MNKTKCEDLKCQRYKNPIDNLIYAILLQAVADLDADPNNKNNPRTVREDAELFLKSDDARAMWEIIKNRPLL